MSITLGSMFALRKGRDMSKARSGLARTSNPAPPAASSNGVLGTLAALEVVRTLNDAGSKRETPICISTGPMRKARGSRRR